MREFTAMVVAVAVSIMPEAALADAPVRFDIPAGPLSTSLSLLARQAGVDVLFSEATIGLRTAPSLHGRSTVDAALARFLAGSGLGFHRTNDGVYVITTAPDAVPAPADADQEAIPEILVIGRRAQNSDIRRGEDDIQPYQVAGRRELEDLHSGSIQAFTRSRLPTNSEVVSPSQNVISDGAPRSEINLRGLGAAQTLILIDGRRMPGFPKLPFGVEQPDINGIPIDAVDRIETLTATAGGIYGPGATAGVINLIMRRGERGLAASLTTGLTTRGDAPEGRLHVRYGFTPDHGFTDVAISLSRSASKRLRSRDRDYLERARGLRYANDPVAFLASPPIANAINIVADQNLVLDQRFGGIALGSRITSLPLGLGGDITDRNALLVANAGEIGVKPPGKLGGTAEDSLGRIHTGAFLFNVRHRFGDSGIEAVVDLIDTRSNSRINGRPQPTVTFISADSPLNPFQQAIAVSLPSGGVAIDNASRTHVMRYTAGVIVPLARKWRANLEYTGGLARLARRGDVPFPSIPNLIYDSVQPSSGRPPIDPLGAWADFINAVGVHTLFQRVEFTQTSRLSDATLRLAGPLISMPGGAATLSLQAEGRWEHVDAYAFRISTPDRSGDLNTPRNSQRTMSLAGELRLPVFGERGPLRKLELQLALRRDAVRATLPVPATSDDIDSPSFESRNTGLAYTLGARLRPSDAIMLRASSSTGILPPTVSQIGSRNIGGDIITLDPKRGNRPIILDGSYGVFSGGSATLKPEHARSLSAGIVLTPFGENGPRASADFTRIDKANEIGFLPGGTVSALLANETLYPGRVGRAPLSSADAALGYTAGRVVTIDLTSANIARSRLDALDLTLDYPLATRRLGELRFYLNGTWQPRYWQQAAAGQPKRDRIGYSDGPLAWRGNGGVDWASGALRLGLNGQFYSRYRVVTSSSPLINAQLLAYQGARHIPAQFYLDFSGSYRLRTGAFLPSGAQVRLGILNLLDHSPPIVTNPNQTGYSYYGDARRRRVDLTIAVPLGGRTE